jgi:PKD repeat protein
VYAWDFDGDGTTDARGAEVQHRYEAPGRHTARLTATDAEGRSATDEVSVVVGNTAPSVSIEWPVQGGIVPFNTPVPYRVSVSDPEDDAIANGRMRVQPYIGRDSHEWPLQQHSGRTGTFTISRTEHYEPKERLFAALGVHYTDGGTPDADSLTGHAHVSLHPRHVEAERAPNTKGVQEETLQNGEGGPSRTVVTAETGQHIGYPAVNLRNVTGLTLRVASMAGGRIEVRRGAPDGALLAHAAVPTAPLDSSASDSTADRDYSMLGEREADWREISVSLSAPEGPAPLFLVFRGREGTPLFRLDWLRFEGPGMTEVPSTLTQ